MEEDRETDRGNSQKTSGARDVRKDNMQGTGMKRNMQ